MAKRPCPCGLPAPYDECCGKLHRGQARAVTAEQLMRSRYSAFAVGDSAYLLKTWHPRTRPGRVDIERGLRWERLEIVATQAGSAIHTEGTVEFRAHYTHAGVAGQTHEVSRFVREGGAWVYLDAAPS
ncbi:YchJ family protein [Nonomuraea sp. NPDC050790]|uniref:YchJ family protein n=1 Tax=Nonomuraea sp. NPDC050790 TaxID=3364371 RepID=UPI0037AC8025